MILKLKPGLIQKSATKLPNGTWVASWLQVSLHGNISSLVELQEISSKEATELPANMKITSGIWILIT
jgi:hypothetical protein